MMRATLGYWLSLLQQSTGSDAIITPNWTFEFVSKEKGGTVSYKIELSSSNEMTFEFAEKCRLRYLLC